MRCSKSSSNVSVLWSQLSWMLILQWRSNRKTVTISDVNYIKWIKWWHLPKSTDGQYVILSWCKSKVNKIPQFLPPMTMWRRFLVQALQMRKWDEESLLETVSSCYLPAAWPLWIDLLPVWPHSPWLQVLEQGKYLLGTQDSRKLVWKERMSYCKLTFPLWTWNKNKIQLWAPGWLSQSRLQLWLRS